ncbi:MAG: TIGR00730 family Rossman fold protein [Leptolyngbyaceae cyanobacterium bins.59]|nr:TIGR00730 family Rossman fold protein [Leptolyngbyaceae cyanobacterium bins.59]
MNRICVFCGSNIGAKPLYQTIAQQMGMCLANRQLELVYGGGNVGLMGTIADAVLAAGGRVTGVIPEALMAKELAHTGLTELHVVGSMHERKALMVQLADGFVALPGGFGTLDEFCEVLTWAQLGFHQKPCGILNVEGYYDSLLALVNHAVQERFIHPEHRSLVLESNDPEQLLDQMIQYQPAIVEKWIERKVQT